MSLIEQNSRQGQAGPSCTGGENPTGDPERLAASASREERQRWEGHRGYTYEEWLAWWEGRWGQAGEARPPAEQPVEARPTGPPEAPMVEDRPAEASTARERSRSNKMPRRCLLPNVGKVRVKSIVLRNIVCTFESKS